MLTFLEDGGAVDLDDSRVVFVLFVEAHVREEALLLKQHAEGEKQGNGREIGERGRALSLRSRAAFWT